MLAMSARKTNMNAGGDLPFTVSRVSGSLSAELTSNDLGQYACRFEEAQIDAELASRMTMQDLGVLLPDVPLGHCLRLHSICQRISEREPDLPSAAVWRACSRRISTGIINGSLSGDSLGSLEFDLVAASLMLTFTVPSMMNPNAGCADGTACVTLRAVDYMLWTSATLFFLFSVGVAWINQQSIAAQLHTKLPQYLLENWHYCTLSSCCFVFGLNILTMAVGTRAKIVLEWPALGNIVCAMMLTWLVLMWSYVIVMGKISYEVKWNQVLWAWLGSYGWYLPARLLHKTPADGGSNTVASKRHVV
jgi:hypothetical protein